MKCYGTCLCLKGLWKDISGQSAELHMRTDANNLVTTAKTTHLPDQKETIHMIQMLRRERCSGNIDLSHVRTEHCLSGCLTKHSAKPDNLLTAVETGVLPAVDTHPNFRELLNHKAFTLSWIAEYIHTELPIMTFFAIPLFDGSRIVSDICRSQTLVERSRTGVLLL